MTFKDRLYPPSGLRVLISAGASGIGATIASAFIETGAQVHVCDVDASALQAFQGRFSSALATQADVANNDQVAAVFQAQHAHFGGLDVLINCAGIAGPTGGIEKISPDDWSRTVEVNLSGQFRFLHHAVPMLRESSSAHVICISSVAGRLGYAWRTPYASTKWAISGLVKSLAIELGPHDVRVNALLPGIVEGPRMDSVIRARAQEKGLTEEAMREDFVSKVSLRRMVTADDVALMCLYLCSPAGRNISGQTISVDGNVEYL
ncbi:Short chain dehydrogenase [Candidatus Sulfopaludibacter sp. SbA3]|nr:Short chain dehydrogenase [Candidatus Sulfopaludibacter sp. SbA3]